jgi:hypothetical protein
MRVARRKEDDTPRKTNHKLEWRREKERAKKRPTRERKMKTLVG